MSDYLNRYKSDFDANIEYFKKEIGSFRIGRANPSLVEGIFVEAYGTKSSLKELASISVSDPKTLNIQPWDKSIIKAIESALQQSDLGASPIVKENIIIVNLPSMTEETRLLIIKKLHQKAEEAKISVKNLREKIRDQIQVDEKDKTITEDQKFKFFDELDNMSKNFNEKIKELTEQKEVEIKQI